MIGMLMFLALAVDVTGQWRATVASGSQRAEVNLSLEHRGDSLTGTVQMQDLMLPIQKGAVQGDGISFSALFPAGGKLVEVPFQGRIEGQQIRLNLAGVEVMATRVPPKPGAERTERLASLFRVWGMAKFFHPYVVRGTVDWDAALLRAIAKVEAAKTKEEYRGALGSMLDELRDPETRVLNGEEGPAPHTRVGQRRVVRDGYYPQVEGGGRGYYAAWEAAGPVAPYIAELPDGIRVSLRTAEAVSPEAELVTAEKTYGESLPSREQRLLALARLWNTIHYFYGYPGNLGNWEDVLSEFIPQFEAATTWRDYVFAITRLASRTNDSHTWIPEFWRQLGSAPAVAIWPVEGQSVVRGTAPGVQGIERGDVIVAIDGKPVEERRKFLMDLYPHSTPQGGWLMINQFLLAGDEPTVEVRVVKADGKPANVRLARSTVMEYQRTTPIYQVLPSGYGYIDLARIPEAEIDQAFDAVLKTPGLILDLRGYPDGGFARSAARLAHDAAPAVLTRRRVWHGPDPKLATVHATVGRVIPSDQAKYTGRVAVLIDASAVSRPEYVGLLLEAAAHPTFIGTPTRGAVGEVTNTILPGGVQVNFAGNEMRHADGRPVQDVGIVPQVWAAPTISGIREGRDEVLEKAVEFLKLSAPTE